MADTILTQATDPRQTGAGFSVPGRAGGLAVLKKYGREHFVRLGKLGFQALVDKHFDGDRERAKRFLADLGRAHFFKDTRRGFANSLMSKYADLEFFDLEF